MHAHVIVLFLAGAALASPKPAADAPAAPAAPAALAALAAQVREPRAASRWRQYLAGDDDYDEYRPRRRSSGAGVGWPFQPMTVNVPLSRGSREDSLPIVLLPVPVPSESRRDDSRECGVTKSKNYNDVDDDYEEPPRYEGSRRGSRPPPRPAPRDPPRYYEREREREREEYDEVPRRGERPQGYSREPSYTYSAPVDLNIPAPVFPPAESSQKLVELFVAQYPSAPELPPALLAQSDLSERVPLPDATLDEPAAPPAPPAPPGPPAPTAAAPPAPPAPNSGRYVPQLQVTRQPARPRFDRSLILRGELTVTKADYTEPYTVWWDASSGAARVDLHGGSTRTARRLAPDGKLQRFEMRVDRSDGSTVRRCGAATYARPAAADRALPGLPDLEGFSFAGYEDSPGGRVERWRRSVAGRAGELGAARGETLTLRHDLLLRRASDDAAVPLLYTVAVDSSVLGPNAEGYEHRYVEVRQHTHAVEFFAVDMDAMCDEVEQLNSSSRAHLARLEPLREFTLPQRDQRYDQVFNDFKLQFNRKYADSTEEAVRKTVLVQHSRFINSCNREGGTFAVEVNFLGDRLDAELQDLQGVDFSVENRKAETFPHPRASLNGLEETLPDEFDWRAKGGVTSVRFQELTCSSCWAFSVVGSVEGALFARTGRLVELSEQCLVDCAQPYGGKGCKGTWPSNAFDYVQDRGLPPLAEYAYKGEVETCREKAVGPVTRISAHVNVTENSVPALKVAIKKHAPTVVLVDGNAKSFLFYKKGVLYDDRCAKTPKKLKHAVLAVGWGVEKGEPHFILKNSWSAKWGDAGYVRVHGRSNTCGVLARPSYPRLELSDVVRN